MQFASAAAVLAGTVLVWLLLPELPPVARVWTAVLMVPLPALMVRQAAELRAITELPRVAAYVSSIIGLWVLAGATSVVAVASGFNARDLGIVSVSAPRVIAFAAVLTAAAVALQFIFRALGTREARVLRELLPVTSRERWLFVLVSLSAGICEELVFRGFLLRALVLGTGVTPLAVLLSAGAFGVVHAYQQPVGAVRAALLGLLLTAPVLLDASLVTSMLAHAAIDVVSGLFLARYLVR